MNKLLITKSNSVEKKEASEISNKSAFKVLLENKVIYKSADQLFTSNRLLPDFRNNLCKKQVDDAVLPNTFEKEKRNSRSEENLLDIKEKVENFNVFFRLKSNSCETNNEFKEETENNLVRAIQERLKQVNINSKIEAEDAISINEADLKTREQICETIEDCADNMMPPLHSPPSGVATDAQGLIVPKKLANPCLDSVDRKNLHRELMFNQKVGKSVLNQKTELQKALQKQKERQLVNAQLQQQKNQNRDQGFSGELGRVIMQRAQRLESLQKEGNSQDDMNNQLNPEYLNARAKLRATVDSK